MMRSVDFEPGSRPPQNAAEMDLLLRRVPEVALLPELAALRFDASRVSATSGTRDPVRIARLADREYLARLREALARLEQRADSESNGGLRFVASSLLHFVGSLAPERHPLVVALYFLSVSEDPSATRAEDLARSMDDYEQMG